ncbi:MAG TPA: dTMP kinase [Bacteroidales bacterium]|nr:dTMP kinase [Bacteroidales bacterium]
MKLIVIEGIDGSGKSTQIKLLKDYLTQRGYRCEFLHFPQTDAPFFGELISRFLRGEFGTLDKVDPWLVAMLYAGDRKDASNLIRGWLENGNLVLLDRYTYSNIAYQCAKLGKKEDQEALMKWILDLEFDHFAIPRPDLNIFLDVPFSFTEKKLSSSRSGNDRKYLSGSIDIHEESLAFQKKVREMYIRVAETDEHLCIISCADEKGNILTPEMISEKVIKLIEKKGLL